MSTDASTQSQSQESPQPLTYAVLSALLGYPDAGLQEALPQLRTLLNQQQAGHLAPLFDLFDNSPDLIHLQEQAEPLVAFVRTCSRRVEGSGAGNG